MKSERTWIVIADGAHAKVLERSAEKPTLRTVDGLNVSIELPASRDMLTDRPGRSFESHGRARHAKESRSDPHRELKRSFAKHLAGLLKTNLADKRYERLVLVAPPAMLGDLRDALVKTVRARVVAELAQDLVKTPHSQLRRHLADVVPGVPARRVASKK
jgi:protein required for attachment to host cells